MLVDTGCGGGTGLRYDDDDVDDVDGGAGVVGRNEGECGCAEDDDPAAGLGENDRDLCFFNSLFVCNSP